MTDVPVACLCHVPVGITGYDVTLPHGTWSAIRRHKARGEECAICGVPQDPPIAASKCVMTGGDRGGLETGVNRSFGDLLNPSTTTDGDGRAAGPRCTSPRHANA